MVKLRYGIFRRFLLGTLGVLAASSFFLLVHNYGISLLPDKIVVIPPPAIQPLAGEKSFAYVWDFANTHGSDELNPQGRARFVEDNRVYPHVQRNAEEVRLV